MIKAILLLKLVFIISVQGQGYWNNLRCRVCERAESFDRCNTYAVCTESEACYMDQIIDGVRILYNGGCRSKNVCMLGKKRKRDNTDLVSCSRCCDGTDFCNDRLCGLKPVANTTFCNSCDGKDGRPHPPQYPEDCPFIKACEPDEVCFSSMRMEDEKTLSHYTTCEKLEICQPLTNFILQSYRTSVGKREETICSACCGDNYCNKYACETTKKRLKYLNSQHRLNLTTIKEIPFFG
ncbi:hypothetical protein ACF0H5_021936 [Mactra antiquata]